MIIIEHNLHVIKSADWVIDMGPEGGLHGGQVVAEGTPETLAKDEKTPTVKDLKEALGLQSVVIFTTSKNTNITNTYGKQC